MSETSPHLSWVSARTASKIISPEHLSAEQKAAVDQILQTAFGVQGLKGTGGVLVGILKGRAESDLRPIILESRPVRGLLSIVRVIGSSAQGQIERSSALRNTMQNLQHLEEKIPREKRCLQAASESGGRFWIRRKFHKILFSEIDPVQKASIPAAQVVRRLILKIKAAHAAGAIHGHICPANIAWEEGDVVLLDFGFAAFQGAGGDYPLAPELDQSGIASAQGDIYGLGVFLKNFLQDAAPQGVQKFVNSMTAPQPIGRPSLAAVEEYLCSEKILRELGDSAASQSRPVVGKLIGAHSAERQVAIDVGPKAAHTAAQTAPSRSRAVTALIVILVIAAAARYGLAYSGLLGGYDADKEARYGELWESERAASLKEVAREALNGDREAQEAIISHAQANRPGPAGVRSSLIKAAFNPIWADQLDSDDRILALALAVSRLEVRPQGELKRLQESHPAVVLSVVGDLALEASEGQFADIPTSYLAQLPSPYGLAFGELNRSKILNMSEIEARALSRILLGDSSLQVLEAYFSRASSQEQSLSKLLIVLPFTALHKELGEPLLSFSAGQGEILSKRIQWFESEKVAGWDSVGKGEKLFLAAGFLPPSQLSEEQLSDLLMFPSAAVRRESQKLLTKKLGSKEYSHTLKFLGSEKNRLTRFQTVSLVAALRLKSENAMSFVSKWFESKPDPQAVFDLLIARSSLPRSDHFNLQAARYLSDKAWSATVEDLRTLSTHPEALARALAYSRLDPTDPQEKAILQGAAAKEPSERIRQELLRKLHSTANPAAALAGPTPLLQPSPTILLPDDMTQF